MPIDPSKSVSPSAQVGAAGKVSESKSGDAIRQAQAITANAIAQAPNVDPSSAVAHAFGEYV